MKLTVIRGRLCFKQKNNLTVIVFFLNSSAGSTTSVDFVKSLIGLHQMFFAKPLIDD